MISGGEALARARVKHFSAARSDWVERNAKICFESREISKETSMSFMQCHGMSLCQLNVFNFGWHNVLFDCWKQHATHVEIQFQLRAIFDTIAASKLTHFVCFLLILVMEDQQTSP